MKIFLGGFVWLSGLVSLSAAPAAAPAWPHPIPCRIEDGANREVFAMTLGDVTTPLATGVFDPVADTVTLRDGTVKPHYYRDVLGVKFYQPLDKSRFPLPPSGWCSWYYYYQHITADEVKANATWVAENLKDYGAQVVQIDDGWQGADRNTGKRDWTTVNAKQFPAGMADVAAHIKGLGLTPGLWIAPHGQSNPEVVKKHPGVFLMKPDGTSASETWEGKFLVDPTAPATEPYLRDLFATMVGWGYDYFKIDGQPIVVKEYGLKKEFMHQPVDDPAGLYRRTLVPMREAMGPDRFLLGCWGIPLEGAGIMNGSRTGGDIVLGWGGFQVSLRPTLEYFYLHNIVWYADPDVMLLRSPLTLDQARVWATLQGLTGQAVISSDRLMDLSAERVDVLRRVYPAVDIRPLDLFPTKRNKRIWDLKINHLGRNYDVVGVFNFDTTKTESTLLRWADLGHPAGTTMHVFDFWHQEYLGAWTEGMVVEAATTSVRVLTLVPATDKIQLVSTNRHITQGWVDLTAASANSAGDVFQGTSKVIKQDPYELRFAFPKGKNFTATRAVARVGGVELPVAITNHQGWSAVRVTSPTTAEISWEVAFAPAPAFVTKPSEPTKLFVERVGLDGVMLQWQEQYYLNAGYQVYLDGQLLGYTPKASFPITGLDPAKTYKVNVRTVATDGTESPKGTELEFTLAPLIPSTLLLSELKPVSASGAWRGYEIEEMLAGAPLKVGEQRFEHGLSSFAGSEIEFELKGLYQKFTALVGLDAASNHEAGAEFVVLADGKELWRSGAMKAGEAARVVELTLPAGTRRLVLRTIDSSPKGKHSQVDWLEARVGR